jgi:hypothetical protein
MRYALALLLLPLSTSATAQTALYQSKQEKFENICEYFDEHSENNLELHLDDAFTYLTLSAEHDITATVFNPLFVKCGERDAELCGTRGCDIVIEVKGKLYNFTGWTPEVITIDNEAMLLVPHSGWMCGATLPNSAPCYTLAVWDSEALQLNYTTPR